MILLFTNGINMLTLFQFKLIRAGQFSHIEYFRATIRLTKENTKFFYPSEQ